MAASNSERKILEGPTEIEYRYRLLKMLLQNMILQNRNHTKKRFVYFKRLYFRIDACY